MLQTRDGHGTDKKVDVRILIVGGGMAGIEKVAEDVLRSNTTAL